MALSIRRTVCAWALVFQSIWSFNPAQAGDFPYLIRPEQRSIVVREPVQIPSAGVPDVEPPRTVTHPNAAAPAVNLSLDDAIRIALDNSEVVRVLAGESAVSSGSTVYDVAIANTAIDERQARFDPSVDWRHNFLRTETPVSILDGGSPAGSRIGGIRTDGYNMDLGVSKTTATGGLLDLSVNTNPQRFQPGIFALTPQNRHTVDLSYSQPLWRGGGIGPNVAPIVIARIDTERSFFQYKNSVQELVRGVIAAYWNLVFARTDVWTRRQQVEQAKFAYDRAAARMKHGIADRSEVSLTQVTWGNFRANLIAAEANVLQREAALRNILGLPPADDHRLVPVTQPVDGRLDFDWAGLVLMAEENRPDLIELKLVTEADEQQLLVARNQAYPSLDANLLYRWNGLEGTTPTGAHISTKGGQFADWAMGVNFSVPLTLRQGRAAMRRQELIVARDRANLRQGVHAMTHSLATNVRNLEQFYERYQLFREVRTAANNNLEEQWAEYRSDRTIFLNVLVAITDWGNAVSSEAQSLTRYNTELASLEQQTGTILESHGIRFFEERFGSIGPLGRAAADRPYPERLPPTENVDRYQGGTQPAEEFFDLNNPIVSRREELPPAGQPLPDADQGQLPQPDNEQLLRDTPQ